LKKKYEIKIDLYLSISNKPNFLKIGKKIKANPKGFMTQVIQNIQQVQNLSDNLKEFSIIPIILFPSEKNQKSADFLGLNLEEYNNEFHKLVTETYKITEDILITSPNDFNGLKDYLEKNW
jgi:homocysteine S-methyltransferase